MDDYDELIPAWFLVGGVVLRRILLCTFLVRLTAELDLAHYGEEVPRNVCRNSEKMDAWGCSANSLASAPLAELLSANVSKSGDEQFQPEGVRWRVGSVFSDSVPQTSSPSGTDAGSHPRCQATELGASLATVWTNTSCRQGPR